MHAHGFLLGFMKSAADWYSSDCSPDIFFLDLLKLDVPSLFFNEKSDLKDLSSLCSQFSCFLQGYYKRMRKHCNFAIIMEQILVCFHFNVSICLITHRKHSCHEPACRASLSTMLHQWVGMYYVFILSTLLR